MAITDRRSGQERRAIPRRSVTIDVEWETHAGRWPGTISDLSDAGCFVLSSGEVSTGDAIKVLVPLGEGMKVQLLGEVRNHVLEIGFALCFSGLTDAQKRVIAELMEKYREDG